MNGLVSILYRVTINWKQELHSYEEDLTSINGESMDSHIGGEF